MYEPLYFFCINIQFFFYLQRFLCVDELLAKLVIQFTSGFRDGLVKVRCFDEHCHAQPQALTSSVHQHQAHYRSSQYLSKSVDQLLFLSEGKIRLECHHSRTYVGIPDLGERAQCTPRTIPFVGSSFVVLNSTF